MRFTKFLAAIAVAATSTAFAQNISIATGGTGGVYYPMGGGLAAVLSKHVSGMQATAEVTGGSVDNLNLIASGKPYVGFSMVDAALDASKGKDKFEGRPVNLRTLLVLYPNRMHVVTTEATGIKKMSDLKGKRIATGSAGSATEVMSIRLLEAAGLDPNKDVTRERLSVAESVNAIKDRKIEAFFWVGGLPTAAVTDLANTPGTKIRMIDHADAVAAMNKKYGNLYYADTIPKATYSGMATDNKMASVANILLVNANMPDDQAYKIVKAVFDHQKDLIAVHQEYANVTIAGQKQASTPIDFHPGAVKYIQEKGGNIKGSAAKGKK
ncbi:MAG: TAXI family TRAP transporter solute-binding subunit [Burkholderiaceae bacterium]|jgi:TRAP transporter TAXI family solute receptor|nr:TAXI family TRAP transporter solute-binding subunit [Betaproteobacteria bacterium]